MRRCIYLVITFLVISDAFASSPSASEHYWISPDRNEVVVIIGKPKSETLYFNNDASRLCYKYRIPGIWRAQGQYGLLVSEDGHSRTGIALYSPQELLGTYGSLAIARASDLLIKAYEVEFATSLTTKELAPFPSSRPGTMKWVVSLYAPVQGARQLVTAHKVFVEIAPGWVAQISLGAVTDPDRVYREIIDSLATTRERGCYWPSIRRQFPNVR